MFAIPTVIWSYFYLILKVHNWRVFSPSTILHIHCLETWGSKLIWYKLCNSQNVGWLFIIQEQKKKQAHPYKCFPTGLNYTYIYIHIYNIYIIYIYIYIYIIILIYNSMDAVYPCKCSIIHILKAIKSEIIYLRHENHFTTFTFQL